jgi:hypothetical protein
MCSYIAAVPGPALSYVTVPYVGNGWHRDRSVLSEMSKRSCRDPNRFRFHDARSEID